MTHSTSFSRTGNLHGLGHNIAVADHTISTDIDSLLQKVNLNSAFTNLAKNDSALVNEMK